MAEWSKAHAWKVCVPHKGTKGSNPFLSAIIDDVQRFAKQTPSYTPTNVELGFL